MRKKTIYLHIGTPKTGTTSIQEYLVCNYNKLYADGYLVPKTSRRNNNNHIYLFNYTLDENRSSRLRTVCKTDTKEEVLEFREQFYKAFRDEIRTYKGNYVVLSNEQSYRSITSEAEKVRLKCLFDGLSDNVKIIIYLREQSDMLCSRYSTSLKNNSRKKISNIEKFGNSFFLDYNQRLKEWEDVFGIENIILKIYDKQKLYQGDVISDFSRTLNIPRYDYKPTFLNASLNAKQCEFLRIINTHFGKLPGKKGLKTQHQLKQMVSNTRIESPSVSDLINKDYQDVYNESNRELASRYCNQEIELFNKNPLNDHSLDQTLLLTEADRSNLATQIIDENIVKNEMLCKCIAAIFDVPYKDLKIPVDYVHAFKISDDDNNFRDKIGYYLRKLPRVLFSK